MKHIVYTILALLLAILPASAQTVTADQMVNKAAAQFRSARSVSAAFTMSGAIGNGSGTFDGSGRKFAFVTTAASTWYNGKHMWTYNPRTQETTVVNPSAQEIAESNPFTIIGSMSGQFHAAFAKNAPAGTKVIVLRPKSAKSPYKKVILTLDASKMTPRKIEVTGQQGTSTINISSYKVNGSLPASKFEYPKSKYPKAKVIDLR